MLKVRSVYSKIFANVKPKYSPTLTKNTIVFFFYFSKIKVFTVVNKGFSVFTLVNQCFYHIKYKVNQSLKTIFFSFYYI